MQLEELHIDKSTISVRSEDILSLLGEGEVGGMDGHTEEVIRQFTSECRKIMTPRGGYNVLKAIDAGSKDLIEIDGVRFETGKIIHKMLRHSESFAFFVATAGPGPEELARKLMDEGAYLEGYITDLIASTLVESVANQVQEQIQVRAASEGLKITNRYSPGYCSWDVSEQQKLFSLFPSDFCDITLSDSSLMSPIKSISAIIGLGSEVVYSNYTCEICPMKTCMFRRVSTQ